MRRLMTCFSRFSFFARFLLLVLAGAGLAAGSAQAAIDSSGAAELRQIIADYIRTQQKAQRFSGNDLVATGSVTVEPSGTYYAITTPHLSLTTAEGGRINLGMLAVNAAPGKAPGEWKMSFAIPTPITKYDESGQPDFSIHIGAQRTSGIWLSSLRNFAKIDAAYKDILLKNPDKKSDLKIADIRVLSDFEEDANGLISGPYEYKVEDMAFTGALEGFFSLEEILVTGKMYDLDPTAYGTMLEKMESFTENTTAADLESANPQKIQAMTNMLFDMFKSMGDGFDTDMRIKNLRIAPKISPKNSSNRSNSKVDEIRLGQLNTGFDIRGLNENNVRLRLRTGFQDFEIIPETNDIAEIKPTEMQLAVSVNNIPFDELISLANNTMSASIQNPAAAQFAGLQAMMSLPQLLTAAGTHLSIDNSYIGNDTYRATAKGKVMTDAAAVKGAVADVTLKLAGLAELVKVMERYIRTADESQLEKFQNALAVLVMLDAIGEERADDKTGAMVEFYHLLMDQQGRLTVNGNSMDTLKALGGKNGAQ